MLFAPSVLAKFGTQNHYQYVSLSFIVLYVINGLTVLCADAPNACCRTIKRLSNAVPVTTLIPNMD